jgi:hypothetical protein
MSRRKDDSTSGEDDEDSDYPSHGGEARDRSAAVKAFRCALRDGNPRQASSPPGTGQAGQGGTQGANGRESIHLRTDDKCCEDDRKVPYREGRYGRNHAAARVMTRCGLSGRRSESRPAPEVLLKYEQETADQGKLWTESRAYNVLRGAASVDVSRIPNRLATSGAICTPTLALVSAT